MSNNLRSPSSDASQHDHTDDADVTLPQCDGADDANWADDTNAPQSLDALPLDFHMEDDIWLNDEQKIIA